VFPLFQYHGADTSHCGAVCLKRALTYIPGTKKFFSDTSRRRRFELLRRALSRVEFYKDGRIALSWVTAQDFEELNARKEDAENLINYWQNVETVNVAVLFKSFEDDTTRVSFRSDASFDSAAFLRQFGGGGHAPAAGATLDMPLEQAKETLLAALLEAVDVSEEA
jgi:bifunctional oligoribonuclease and PAP phosphatase NrnA